MTNKQKNIVLYLLEVLFISSYLLLVVFAHLFPLCLDHNLFTCLLESAEYFWQVNQLGPIWQHVHWSSKHRRRVLRIPQSCHGGHASSKPFWPFQAGKERDIFPLILLLVCWKHWLPFAPACVRVSSLCVPPPSHRSVILGGMSCCLNVLL